MGNILALKNSNVLALKKSDVLALEKSNVLTLNQSSVLALKKSNALALKESNVMSLKKSDVPQTVLALRGSYGVAKEVWLWFLCGSGRACRGANSLYFYCENESDHQKHLVKSTF